MISTLPMFGGDAHVVIDLGAIHYFILCEDVARVGMSPIPLGHCLEISTP